LGTWNNTEKCGKCVHNRRAHVLALGLGMTP